MREPKLDPARYAEGIATYTAGHGIATVVATCAAIEKLHEAVESGAPDHGMSEAEYAEWRRMEHDAIENAIPSFLAGFAEGFLSDFRRLVGQPGRMGGLDETARALKQDAGLTA